MMAATLCWSIHSFLSCESEVCYTIFTQIRAWLRSRVVSVVGCLLALGCLQVMNLLQLQ